jgi:hypothetical protein
MEPDKAFNEALFRSRSATEKANQAQNQLYNMGTAPQHQDVNPSSSPQPELNESPRNLMQSWHTLRKLDEDLAEKMSGEGNVITTRKKPGTKMK